MTINLYLDNNRKEVYRIEDIIKSDSDNQFEVQDRIDSGGNAVVHKCADIVSGDEYAIKFHLSVGTRRLKRFKQEIELLKHIKHDQLIKYIDDGKINAIVVEKNRKRRIPLLPKSRRLQFLIMSLAEVNLKDYLKSQRKNISYEEYIAQFKGLASALAALHQKAIHRDIKPENILIKGETWLLSDLGLCEFIERPQDITLEYEPIGPRYWMSPEALNKLVGNNDDITKASDVFQLCSIFWFVVTGRHPSGILTIDDWTGPANIFTPIFQSLSHNSLNRPSDANQLLEQLNDVAF